MNSLLAVSIAAYLVLMLVVALYASGNVETEEDYLVAGRRLPMWLSVGTLLATWFGAGTLLTASDEIFASGLAVTALEPYGAGLCLILAGAVFAEPMWKSGHLTLCDMMRARFGPGIETAGAIYSVASYSGWVAVQFGALAGILKVFFGIPLALGVLGVAAVSTLYTMVGGMWSVTLTDTIQVGILIPGLLILFYKVFAFVGDGGFAAGMAKAVADAPPGHLILIPHGSAGELFSWFNVLTIAMVGNIASQDLFQRILASRSALVAKRSCYISGVLYCVLGTIPAAIAIAAPGILSSADGISILPALAAKLLTPGLSALFALSLISIVMSSITSGLLAPATQLSRNLLRRRIPESLIGSVRLSQLSVAVVAAISALVALSGGSMYVILEGSYSLGLVSFFPPICIALFGKRFHGPAAMSAVLAGAAVWSANLAAGARFSIDLLAMGFAFGVYFVHLRLAMARGLEFPALTPEAS